MVCTFKAETNQIRISSMVITAFVLLHIVARFRCCYIIFYFTYIDSHNTTHTYKIYVYIQYKAFLIQMEPQRHCSFL